MEYLGGCSPLDEERSYLHVSTCVYCEGVDCRQATALRRKGVFAVHASWCGKVKAGLTPTSEV
jgi:hypothetical protein